MLSPFKEDDLDSDAYDPNAEAEQAYEREIESRLAREQMREWEPAPSWKALQRQLDASTEALNRTLDDMEACLDRIKRFLMLDGKGVGP